MKRFYDNADIEKADKGWQIVLDGRPMKTPAKAKLAVPGESLARAIAEEWQSQEEEVDPFKMPLTGLANAAIDRVAPNRQAVAGEIAVYGETDLLCYRVEQPVELRQRQDEAWQPLLEWAQEALGVSLRVTQGILPTPQDRSALERLSAALEALDAFSLTSVMKLAQGTNSVILALSVAHGRLEADSAFDLSLVDEIYQEELWGQDQEALERREAIRVDLGEAGRFLKLARL